MYAVGACTATEPSLEFALAPRCPHHIKTLDSPASPWRDGGWSCPRAFMQSDEAPTFKTRSGCALSLRNADTLKPASGKPLLTLSSRSIDESPTNVPFF